MSCHDWACILALNQRGQAYSPGLTLHHERSAHIRHKVLLGLGLGFQGLLAGLFAGLLAGLLAGLFAILGWLLASLRALGFFLALVMIPVLVTLATSEK
jgi:hypothetical protein